MNFFDIDDVSVTFGGLRAISHVSISLKKGHIHALIGPNGAGKTSLINAIMGLVSLAGGRIVFQGTEVQRLAPHMIAAQGIGRTFQHAEIFPDQTVLENVITGAYAHRDTNIFQDFIGTPAKARAERRLVEEADAMLDRFRLLPMRDQLAADLPFGTLKKVDLARALMAKPKLLMLDEPVSGMNQTEAQEAIVACRRVSKELDVTLLVVEHNMRVVMELADHIFVLDHGEKIAEGSPSEVQQNPLVIEAYLGVGAVHHA